MGEIRHGQLVTVGHVLQVQLRVHHALLGGARYTALQWRALLAAGSSHESALTFVLISRLRASALTCKGMVLRYPLPYRIVPDVLCSRLRYAPL